MYNTETFKIKSNKKGLRYLVWIRNLFIDIAGLEPDINYIEKNMYSIVLQTKG